MFERMCYHSNVNYIDDSIVIGLSNCDGNIETCKHQDVETRGMAAAGGEVYITPYVPP